MKVQNKNLLSKILSERDALNRKLSKIKLRFPGGFKRLAIIQRITVIRKIFIVSFALFTLSGYYPALAIPPVKRSVVTAVVQEQKGEVIAKSFSKPVILPHPGYLTTRFSAWHPGVDIAIGLGMPVHPVTDGEVSEVGRDLFGLGNFVGVTHENGFKSKYAHMGRIFVKIGDKVTSENTLGEVGLTGRTSGPHTHLEITLNGNYIDPQTLLPEIPNLPTSTQRADSNNIRK